MSTPGIVVGACLLAASSSDVRFDGVGWEERVRVDLVAAEGCDGIDMDLPDGVTLRAWQAKVRPADAKPYLLGPERLERTDVVDTGVRIHHLHMPELEVGDTVQIDLVRGWVLPQDFHWAPGADGARFAELRMPRGLEPRYAGVQLDKRTAWASEPAEGATLTLEHPWADRQAPPLAPPGDDGLSAVHAHARIVTRIEPVTRAWFGREPALGLSALQLGMADDRGIARTLVALAEDGPDVVELGRWSADASTPPAPGAFEVAIHRARWGAVPLPHPDQTLPAGVFHTPSGPVTVQGRVPTYQRWEPGFDRVRDLTEVLVNPGDGRVRVQRHAQINVRGDDPLKTLGRSDALVYAELWAVGSAPSAHRGVYLPLPADHVEVFTDPAKPCDRVRVTHDAAWLVLPREGEPCGLVVMRPLRDAFGEGTSAAAVWTRPDGVEEPGDVVIEDGMWRIERLAGVELLSTPERLRAQVEARFRAAAMPEPGVRAASRAGRNGWDFAAALREIVRSRVTVAPLPVPAYRPRPLHAARRGRAMTEAEAAMLGSLYLRQARVEADWVLLRTGDSDALTPVGYDAALIHVRHEGRQAWIDLGCDLCGPFEVRPELIGALGLGPELAGLPRPVPVDGLLPAITRDGALWLADEARLPSGVGAWSIVESTGEGRPTASWTLGGADALHLRRTLSLDAADQRGARLAFLVHAAPDEPVAFQGIADAGAPIELSAVVTRPEALDPLDLDPAELGRSLRLDLPWLGLRSWERPAADNAADGAWACDDPDRGWAWRAQRQRGRVIEQVLFRSTTFLGSDHAELATCRRQLAP